jgi:hypothetical protein
LFLKIACNIFFGPVLNPTGINIIINNLLAHKVCVTNVFSAVSAVWLVFRVSFVCVCDTVCVCGDGLLGILHIINIVWTMPFRRTFVALAGKARTDVAPHLKKVFVS